MAQKRKSMAENRWSISGSRSYGELADYWDSHSLADQWESTSAVEFELNLKSSAIYFPVDKALAEKLRAAASAHGVSPETLLNMWLQGCVLEEDKKAG
jgi:hypothetical protein